MFSGPLVVAYGDASRFVTSVACPQSLILRSQSLMTLVTSIVLASLPLQISTTTVTCIFPHFFDYL